jgi:hypothetical protein
MPLLLTIADGVTDLTGRHFVTDMFPAREHLGQAFRDLINFLNWTKIAIVYDDEEGKNRMITCPPRRGFRIQPDLVSWDNRNVCVKKTIVRTVLTELLTKNYSIINFSYFFLF